MWYLRKQLLSKNTAKKVVLKQELIRNQPHPLWTEVIQGFRNGISFTDLH